jgi:hypothetical protein
MCNHMPAVRTTTITVPHPTIEGEVMRRTVTSSRCDACGEHVSTSEHERRWLERFVGYFFRGDRQATKEERTI